MGKIGNRLSLQARIYLGFAVLFLLILVTAVSGYAGVARLQAANEMLRRTAVTNSDLLRIDRGVQELRFRVSRYISSGYESLHRDILTLIDELATQIETTRASEDDPAVTELFQRMRGHIVTYREQFDKVVAERNLQASLVHESLPDLSRRINAGLDQVNTSNGETESDLETALLVLRAETAFSQAEKLLLRYFDRPDSRLASDALLQLNTAHQSVDTAATTPATGVNAQAVQNLLDEYRRTSTRAVQATRGFLYFVNVVMAGEASEVTYYSRELRHASEARQAALVQEMADITTTTSRAIVASVVIALLVALAVSLRLAYLVVHPITALTTTFQRLAEGESMIMIPGTERGDEIGAMSKAARVFSDQNQNTKELLERSETLRNELKEQTEELEATNADLDSFAYVASHDLKSPLRGIRQLSEWIEEDVGPNLPPDSRRHLSAMVERITKMETLLNDLLQYSRAGRADVAPEEVDLGQMLRSLVALIDNPAAVAITYPDDLPRLHTARVALEQVLLNLIGNAVKHNDRAEGGRVALEVTRHDSYYLFRVSDNGPGINPKHHDRVFQMYQRVGNPNVDGSGMGLAIVKKQIERMGGCIALKSAPGEGATFEFTWPVTMKSKSKEV